MARSQPANKNAKAKASAARPGCPYIRLPYERHPVGISFDPDEGQTHQSFKDECDVNNIIDLHTRTGLVTHLNPGSPQYGDCPESTLFEAALAQAEMRSAVEDGWEPPQDESEDSEPESALEPQIDSEASEEVSDTENA